MSRPRVALATRASLHPLGVAELAFVQQALQVEGIEAEPVVWTQDVDLAPFDACVVRSTWDYPERLDEFRAWLRRTERATRLWNPAAAIEWNLHKGYLLDLAEKGVAIPPTRLVRQGAPTSLAALLDAEGWARAVVKPAVGVTAIGAMRVSRAEAPAGQAHLDALLARGDALVQAYVPGIESAGEVSIFAFGGEPAHAVRKTPAPGDYRVQSEYGGRATPTVPSPAEQDLARRALAAASHDLLYARVDVVTLPDGAPALMELEAIEPYLFLDRPETAQPYAKAIARALSAQSAVSSSSHESIS